MEFNEILKECYNCFLDRSRGYEKLCELCEKSIKYIDIYDKLNNLIKIDYSNKDYTLNLKFVEIINNFIKLKKIELDNLSPLLNERFENDYVAKKRLAYNKNRKRKETVNISLLLKKLSELKKEDLSVLKISDDDISILVKYIKLFNSNIKEITSENYTIQMQARNIIDRIIKGNCFETLQNYGLDIMLFEPLIEDDYLDITRNTYLNICTFIYNNKELLFSYKIFNNLIVKLGFNNIDDYKDLDKFIMLIDDKSIEKNIRNSKQRLSLIFNRIIIYNTLYEKYGSKVLDRIKNINNIIFKEYYSLLASKLNLDDDYEIESNPKLLENIIKVDKSIPNIIYDNDYLGDNILSKDSLNLILDIFDPDGQFKDLTDIEIVNVLLDVFICDDKTKFIDDNKYKDLSNKIKTIINKRNKN